MVEPGTRPVEVYADLLLPDGSEGSILVLAAV